MTRKEIRALRKELPKRGYTDLIMEKAETPVSIDEIRNYFSGREVKAEKQIIIVLAAKKVIKERQKATAQLQRRLRKG